MKRFVTILLLALAAVLTTCTPCEAKKREVVVASVFVRALSTLRYDSCEFYESDVIA